MFNAQPILIALLDTVFPDWIGLGYSQQVGGARDSIGIASSNTFIAASQVHQLSCGMNE
jgi:hypothetical protein